LVRHWFLEGHADCQLYGIVIRMFANDHPPPHFHARYGEYHVRVSITTGEVIEGELPRPRRAWARTGPRFAWLS
jgi:hypothetical protein